MTLDSGSWIYRVEREGGLWAFYLGHPNRPPYEGRRAQGALPRPDGPICTAQMTHGRLKPLWWHESIKRPRGGLALTGFVVALRKQLGLLAPPRKRAPSRLTEEERERRKLAAKRRRKAMTEAERREELKARRARAARQVEEMTEAERAAYTQRLQQYRAKYRAELTEEERAAHLVKRRQRRARQVAEMTELERQAEREKHRECCARYRQRKAKMRTEGKP